ncbi:hypothetical protein [uncultured Mucilaginibacter sp.]|uniref:hypothetical protein n=1 Tax=uncultured Mucilaginibacter sp. TaxID=797541 RepID=UPI0026290C7C|nr:hypothetical protein [uncultured Mucilaginibacter sp.]
MKFFNYLILITASFISSNMFLYAQTTSTVEKNDLYLNTFAGYGTENNWGNTGFFLGATLSKPISKHIFLEAGLTRFTTDLYNIYKRKPTGFQGEDRYYNAWFLPVDANYTFGNKESFINTSIKIGPALKYQNDKILKTFNEYQFPDGHQEVVQSSIQYYYEKGFNISIYSAVSVSAKINSKLRMGIVLDTYSKAIPIEHWFAGINAVFKL